MHEANTMFFFYQSKSYFNSLKFIIHLKKTCSKQVTTKVVY